MQLKVRHAHHRTVPTPPRGRFNAPHARLAARAGGLANRRATVSRGNGSATLPRELATILKSAIPGLATEIYAEIAAGVPEFSVPGAQPLQPLTEQVIQQSIVTFVNRVADPHASTDELAAALRELGRKAVERGRSLDAVQAALRVAGRIAWRRTADVCARHDVAVGTVARLAEAELDFMDELSTMLVDIIQEAASPPLAEFTEVRRRLLRAILQRPRLPDTVLTDLAQQAGWNVPAEATPVALPAGARWTRAIGDGDVLFELADPEPWLLFPGEADDERLAMLTAGLPMRQAVVGLTVPLEQIGDSLRWSRQILDLARQGAIEDGPLILAERHLLEVWLSTDPMLLEEITERRLGELLELPDARREALTQTLRVWLETWKPADDVGQLLHVHPQTVRYRLHQIRGILGDRLDAPEARFTLELVLRARALRQRYGAGDLPDRPP
jgi:PucR-like helix-turn-helix protein